LFFSPVFSVKSKNLPDIVEALRERDTYALCEVGIILERIDIIITLDVCMVISFEAQSFSETERDIDVAHEVVGVACVDVVAPNHAEVAFDYESVVEQLC
jgi:hypothetical protein